MKKEKNLKINEESLLGIFERYERRIKSICQKMVINQREKVLQYNEK